MIKTTMSLAALAAMATSASAIENVKVGGNAKLWYQTATTNADGAADLFNQKTAVGLGVAELSVKADLFEGLSGQVNTLVLDSLGLENDFVNNISNATTGFQAGDDSSILNTQFWAPVAKLNYKTGNTDIGGGRMTIDSPLLFTEKWNAGYNTFEGAIVTNSDVPNTKLTAMYITGNNGAGLAGSPGGNAQIPFTTTYGGHYYGFGSSVSAPIADGTTVVTDGKKSLLSAGAQFNASGLKVNLWGYHIESVKNAYWLDASYSMAGIFLGVQNSGVYGEDRAEAYGATGDNMLTAFKLGYTLDKFNIYGAYSFTKEGDPATSPIVANFSTNRKSKVYTQAVVQDGAVIGAQNTTAWKVAGSYKFETVKLIGLVQNVDQKDGDVAKFFRNATETDIIASYNVNKNVNLKGIFMYRFYDKTNTGTASKDSDSFNFVRLIATAKF